MSSVKSRADEVLDDSAIDVSEDEGLAKAHITTRRLTNETNPHPGDVRINVKGAFIVDVSPPSTPPTQDFDTEGYQHDPNDIRLPNHRAVVSHIAVDVSALLLQFSVPPPLSRPAEVGQDILTAPITDRRQPCQARLLLARAGRPVAGRPA